jgi:hypothetical protein
MGWLQLLLGPLTNFISKRQDRKLAQQTAKTKIEAAKQEQSATVELNKDEWEQLQVDGMDKTWKDEYVTVSVMSIFNIVVVGGVASAFGYPQVLEGIVTSVTALTAIGVDVGFLLSATVLAGLGLSVWKRM